MLVAAAIIFPILAVSAAYLYVAHRRHQNEACADMIMIDDMLRASQARQMELLRADKAKGAQSDTRTLPCEYLDRQ